MYLSIYQDVSTYWKENDMSTQLADGIHMIVETEEEDLMITEGDFTPHDKLVVIQYIVISLSNMSGIPHNEIMENVKKLEETTTEAKEK